MGLPSRKMETSSKVDSRQAFERLLAGMRPRLHRYCARMTGSVIDGEDVVQEVLVRATEAQAGFASITNPEPWLLRVAHNACLDFLRQRARRNAISSSEDPDMLVDHGSTADRELAAAASLRTFMRLPVAQRSTVILMDVLGHSLEEITGITASSLPAVKAALHRGRERLRELAAEPDDRPLPVLTAQERELLAAYVEHFNARDFDAVRDMLAEEVRLDLVGRLRKSGKSDVSTYVTNYSSKFDWRLALGFVDGRPAVLASDPHDSSGKAAYFVLLNWTGRKVSNIKDFRYARYVMDGAEVLFVS